jgi:hypothetical protein
MKHPLMLERSEVAPSPRATPLRGRAAGNPITFSGHWGDDPILGVVQAVSIHDDPAVTIWHQAAVEVGVVDVAVTEGVRGELP